MTIAPPAEGAYEREGYVSALQETSLEEFTTIIGGAVVSYTVETPASPIDDTPIIIAAGFYGIEPGYRDLRGSLAQRGKTTITYRRGIRQGLDFFDPRHFLKPYRLTQQSPYSVMRDLQRNHDMEEFDVVGHSMGGTTAVDIARHHPKYFRSIVLLGSAGLNGHGLANLAVRSPIFLSKELAPSMPAILNKFNFDDAKHAVEYAGSNPVRVLSEAVHVARHDIRPDFQMLKASGIKTGVLAFEGDEFFPVQSVRQHSKNLPDEYSEIAGNHISPQVNPEFVASHILNMLSILNS